MSLLLHLKAATDWLSKELSQLGKGDFTIVTGRCGGKKIDVILNDCYITPVGQQTSQIKNDDALPSNEDKTQQCKEACSKLAGITIGSAEFDSCVRSCIEDNWVK